MSAPFGVERLPLVTGQGKIPALSLLYLTWRRMPPFFGFNELGYIV
jgi:hypothetical protein